MARTHWALPHISEKKTDALRKVHKQSFPFTFGNTAKKLYDLHIVPHE
jgi:hypothetical protein